MAIEGALLGLFAGADHQVIVTNYTTAAKTVVQDVTGWAIELDVRTTDRSIDPPKLTAIGVISGTFNSAPASNTQVTTFSLSAALLATSIFKGDDTPLRYSIWRTDTGFRQPLRYGDVVITRVTQA